MPNRTQHIGFTLPELMVTEAIPGFLTALALAAPSFKSTVERRNIMRKQPEYSSAFTLIELMITVSIAGILMAIAIPSFLSTIRSNRLTTYTNELVTSLNLARSEAVKRQQQVVVRKTGAEWENGWQVFVDISRVGANANTFDDNGVAPLCESAEDCVLRTYSPIQTSFTLRGNANFVNFIRFTPAGISNNFGSFAICDNSDGNNAPEANTSKLITVNAIGRPHLGIDNDNDGIPEKDDGTEITSCTVSPF